MRVRKTGDSTVIGIFASLTVGEITSIFVIKFDLCENERKIQELMEWCALD